MRRVSFLAFALLLATPAFTQSAYAQSTLTIGLREDPDILDPTLGSSYVGRIVYAAMCDKLIDIDAKLNFVPQLATAWEWEDPTHLVLHLRPNVLFQNGETFDAEAVRYKINRDQTFKGSMRAGEVNMIAAVQVVDPLTVRLVLKAPSASLLSMLADRAGIMVAPKAAEAAGAQFGLHPVCAGPYAFESRVAQDSIVLKRFPGYWDAADYHFDRVIYRPIPNSAARLASLQAGTIDLSESVLPTDVDTIRHDPNLALAIGDGLAYTGINLNLANGPAAKTSIGQSALVRHAFELSLDRTIINQVVYAGLYTPTVQANPPSSPYYIADLQPPARDVAGAKALLQQAGVTPPVPVELTVTNSPDARQVGEVIQSMAAEAGFAVKLRVLEFASSLQAGYAGDFQAYMIGWSGRVDPDGNTWQLLHTGGTFNYGKWSNPAADSLLDEARTATGEPTRNPLYGRFWKLERTDLPLIYLWTTKNLVGMRAHLRGFRQIPDGLIRLRGVYFER